MVSFRYGGERLWFRARQLLRLNTVLERGPVRVDVIAPPEERSGPAGIVLPGQLEKVTKPGFGTDPRHEIESFLGARRPIAATMRYEVRNALLYRSDIYHRGHRKFFNVHKTIHNTNRDVEHHASVIVRSSMVGCHFFGHWLTDDCVTPLIDCEPGQELFMPSPGWIDKQFYREIFGLNQRELYACTADRLVFFDDIGHNADKVRRQRLRRGQLRQRIKAQGKDAIVYMKRGHSATSRTLLNEDEVIARLTQEGVTIVEAEKDGPAKILSTLMDARMLVSVEGSQMAHGMFTIRDGGCFLAIQPPDRFFNTHMDWIHPLDMRYGVLVGDAAEDGFTVNVDDLLRTIDLFPG